MEAPPPPRLDYAPTSGTEVQGLLDSTRRSPSSDPGSSRRSSNAEFVEDLAALRIKNGFPPIRAGENNCFITGCALESIHLQRAHLVPHSETCIPDVIDGLQMLGLLPSMSTLRNVYKHTWRNLLPMETALHAEMDRELPRLVLAPTNEELVSMIGKLEGHLAAAERLVAAERLAAAEQLGAEGRRVGPDRRARRGRRAGAGQRAGAEHPPLHTHFEIHVDRVLEATVPAVEGLGIVDGVSPGLPFHKMALNIRGPPNVGLGAGPQSVGTGAWASRPLYCARMPGGAIPHLPQLATFPVTYDPPLPEVWTALNISNLTILFISKLRDLKASGAVSDEDLSKEMLEKEALARHYISLLCTDTLSAWRDLPRPESLPQIGHAPVTMSAPLVTRLYFAANVSLPTRSNSRRAKIANQSSSDPAGVEGKVLRLGEGIARVNLAADTADVEGNFTSPATGGDAGVMLPAASGEAGVMLSTGSDEDSTSGSGSVLSDGSTGETSPDNSRDRDDEDVLQDKVKCEGCVQDSDRCNDLETREIPKAQNAMRNKFKERADRTSTGQALLEVFFLEEGLKHYPQLRAKLSALADELDQLKFGALDPATHTCLRQAAELE